MKFQAKLVTNARMILQPQPHQVAAHPYLVRHIQMLICVMPPVLTTPEPVNETSAQPPHSVVVDVDEAELLRPSGAINSMVDQKRVENLTMMFPRIPHDVIRNAVVTCASMNTAVNVLLQYGDIDHDSNPNASSASTSSDNNSNIETQDSPAQFCVTKREKENEIKGDA